MMRAITLKILAGVLVVLGTSFPAQALPININPDLDSCTVSPACLLETGTETSQDEISDYLEATYDVDELYKRDVGKSDVGPAADWYSTEFFNTPTDPKDATLTWGGGSFITSKPLYLLVKDGNHTPAWYLFKVTGWDGKQTIEMTDFWPGKGAISHVSLYQGPASVPDGGSMAMLLAMALMGLVVTRRMQS